MKHIYIFQDPMANVYGVEAYNLEQAVNLAGLEMDDTYTTLYCALIQKKDPSTKVFEVRALRAEENDEQTNAYAQARQVATAMAAMTLEDLASDTQGTS